MPPTVIAQSSTVGSKGRITIPKAIRDHVGLEEGQHVAFQMTSTGVEIVPLERVPPEQRWFYTPEIQARVAEAECDIRERRVTVAASVEELQAQLDELKSD